MVSSVRLEHVDRLDRLLALEAVATSQYAEGVPSRSEETCFRREPPGLGAPCGAPVRRGPPRHTAGRAGSVKAVAGAPLRGVGVQRGAFTEASTRQRCCDDRERNRCWRGGTSHTRQHGIYAPLRDMWRVTPRLSPAIRAEGFMRYLTRNEPMRALAWISSNRRMMCNYGDWWVVPAGSNSAVMHIETEYTWIEHCHVGGAEGTLLRCGVSPVVSAELKSPYCGKLCIRWD